VVLAEAEVELHAAIGPGDRDPEFLSPRVVGLGDGRERVDDLVVQALVSADQRADVADRHAYRASFRGIPR
jgi:hypothetical protein